MLNQLTQQRVLIFPALAWRRLEENLIEEFKGEAALIVASIGRSLGGSFAEEMIDEIGDPPALAKCMSDVLDASGWGVFSIVGDTRYGTKVVISVANCVFCEKLPSGDFSRCDFLVGVVKGILDRVYGTPHMVREERCEAAGESVCELVAEECKPFQRCAECANAKYCEAWSCVQEEREGSARGEKGPPALADP